MNAAEYRAMGAEFAADARAIPDDDLERWEDYYAAAEAAEIAYEIADEAERVGWEGA